MRVLIFTGKGGVGKTTVAAATALSTAARGYKTLVMSTDAAHSLADSFGVDLTGSVPVNIEHNLWAQEVDVLEELSHNWQEIQKYIASVMNAIGNVGEIISEDMAILPGLEEMCALLEIFRMENSDEYDCLVVDCAPTGQTLKLLSLPDVAQWWIDKILPVERRVARTVRKVKPSIKGVPVPTDQFYDAMERLFYDVGALKKVLMDPEKTSLRLVVNPESMVIEEAQRAYTYLNLYGYPVDGVIANKIIPPQVSDEFFRSWRETQARHLETIKDVFSPLPVIEAFFMQQELSDKDHLENLAEKLYKDRQPLDIYYKGQPQTITKEGNDYIFSVELPFIEKSDLELRRKGDDRLILQIGNWRREIFLPSSLSQKPLKKAKLENGILTIRFEGGNKHDRKIG
ncbi:MAG: ArsA family ATPase [Desulfovibrionales bacterium]